MFLLTKRAARRHRPNASRRQSQLPAHKLQSQLCTLIRNIQTRLRQRGHSALQVARASLHHCQAHGMQDCVSAVRMVAGGRVGEAKQLRQPSCSVGGDFLRDSRQLTIVEVRHVGDEAVRHDGQMGDVVERRQWKMVFVLGRVGVRDQRLEHSEDLARWFLVRGQKEGGSRGSVGGACGAFEVFQAMQCLGRLVLEFGQAGANLV